MRKALTLLACIVAVTASAQVTTPAGSPVQIAGSHLCAPLDRGCDVSTSKKTTSAPVFTLRKEVREVRVEFSVTDKAGRHIGNISKNDFQLSDNGVRIPELTDFRQETDLPIRLAILIDSSRSTAHQLPVEKQMALGFLRSLLRPQDRAMIASFSTHLSVPTSFTDRFDQLENSVTMVKADGLTALNDSIYELANDDFDAPTMARKVVVVITDGYDSVSRRSFRDALDSVLRNEVTVYTISVRDKKSLEPAECLSEMSSATGGHSYVLKNLKNLKNTFDQIDGDLRSYYVAAYRAPDRDGMPFHEVKVQMATKGLAVQNKKGYFRTE